MLKVLGFYALLLAVAVAAVALLAQADPASAEQAMRP